MFNCHGLIELACPAWAWSADDFKPRLSDAEHLQLADDHPPRAAKSRLAMPVRRSCGIVENPSTQGLLQACQRGAFSLVVWQGIWPKSPGGWFSPMAADLCATIGVPFDTPRLVPGLAAEGPVVQTPNATSRGLPWPRLCSGPDGLADVDADVDGAFARPLRLGGLANLVIRQRAEHASARDGAVTMGFKADFSPPRGLGIRVAMDHGTAGLGAVGLGASRADPSQQAFFHLHGLRFGLGLGQAPLGHFGVGAAQ